MGMRRRGFTVVAALILVGLGVTRRDEVGAILGTFATLAPAPFLVAVGISVAGVINRAGQFRAAHRLAGLDATLGSMTRVSAAGYALNKAVKTAGLGGVALFVRHGRQRGFPAGGVLAACLISSLSGHLALGVVVVVAVTSLLVAGSLTGSWLVAALAVLLGLVVGLPSLAVVGFRSRDLVHRWYPKPFAAAGRLAARLGRSGPAAPDASHVDRFYDALDVLRHRPISSIPVLAHAVGAKAVGAAVLVASLAAVGAEVSPLAAITIYALALVAATSSFLPGGFGAVEASMTVALANYGVPTTTALAGIFTFRLLDMWFPIVVGLLAAPGLDRPSGEPAGLEVAPPVAPVRLHPVVRPAARSPVPQRAFVGVLVERSGRP